MSTRRHYFVGLASVSTATETFTLRHGPARQLWAELIFPWCGGLPTLLRLRAVCRAFRAQLDASRLWLPLTMELPQLRYDERLAGWVGVERGMVREVNTRAIARLAVLHWGPC